VGNCYAGELGVIGYGIAPQPFTHQRTPPARGAAGTLITARKEMGEQAEAHSTREQFPLRGGGRERSRMGPSGAHWGKCERPGHTEHV
jgi:hypothetical protein